MELVTLTLLENSAISSAHLLGFGDKFWFQDDGAPSHRLVADWKAENNLRCLGPHKAHISTP